MPEIEILVSCLEQPLFQAGSCEDGDDAAGRKMFRSVERDVMGPHNGMR
jgi:hypothetical protein